MTIKAQKQPQNAFIPMVNLILLMVVLFFAADHSKGLAEPRTMIIP
jgi:hypothetical protein